MTRINNGKLSDSPFYQIKELGEEWNEKLLDIARESPVESSGIHIMFDRSPNIFTIPILTSQKYRCGGLFKKGELFGYAIATYQKRYIDDQRLADVMYLGNMHVSKKGRMTGFFYRVSDFFFGGLPNEVEYYYAYIMQKNEAALKLVDRRHPRFPNAPFAKIVGQISMINIFLTIPICLSSKYMIRAANHDDIDLIVELLQMEYSTRFLAPEMNRAIFLRNIKQRPNFGLENYIVAIYGNDIVGVCSSWDMTSFKKNRVLKYGSVLGLTRFLYNIAAPLLGIASLPKAGEPFRDVTITEYAIRERNPVIMNALLRYLYMYYRKKGYHSIIFGSSNDDPLLNAVKNFYTKEIHSNVVLGSKQRDKIERNQNIPLIYADSVQI